MYQRILLATDGSDHSKRAAENAIHIAKCSSDSMLEVVYVVDAEQAKSDVLSNWNSIDLNDRRKERMIYVEEKAKEAGITYDFKLLHGEPGPAIVQFVNNSDIDLVVIGSRGLNVFQEFVLGSVSHKVAKRANCPVLIVK